MSKTELTRIICNPFNPKKGIKLRRALRGCNKIRYFLGKRLYECFVTKNGEKVDVKNSKQIKDYGQWLLNEKYIVPNKVVDKSGLPTLARTLEERISRKKNRVYIFCKTKSGPQNDPINASACEK